jgi:hypothetical protein
MTTQEMLQEVFEALGEPTDLEINATPGDPATFNIALSGTQRLLRVLNQACVRIANWRYDDGRLLRFRSLYKTAYWQNPGPIDVTALTGSASGATFNGIGNDIDGEFNGWWLEVTSGTGQSQKRLIVDSAVALGTVSITVDHAWDTQVDATSVMRLRKTFADLVDPALVGAIYGYHVKLHPDVMVGDILRIRDLTDAVDLGRAYTGETYSSNMMNTGNPTEFSMFGNRIMFDAAIDAARSYEILYYKNPAALTSAMQIAEIPVAFHEAVCLYCLHRMQLRGQDYDGQYVVKQNLKDLMNDLRMTGAMTYEMDELSLVVWG